MAHRFLQRTVFVVLCVAPLFLSGQRSNYPTTSGLVDNPRVPEGMQDYLMIDKCGMPKWLAFQAAFEKARKEISLGRYAAGFKSLVEISRPMVSIPQQAFECGTALGATYLEMAKALDALGMRVRALRMRQQASLWASFDFQMKGEEWIDGSVWPFKWSETVETLLVSKDFMQVAVEPRMYHVPWRDPSFTMQMASAASGVRAHIDQPHDWRLKVAIVSVCDYDAGTTMLAELSQTNKKMYADKFGYDLTVYEKSPILEDALTEGSDLYSSRPPAWSKIDAVLIELGRAREKGYDWVMWMDCDSYFMDTQVRIEEAIGVAALERNETLDSLHASPADHEAILALKSYQPSSARLSATRRVEEWSAFAVQVMDAVRESRGEKPLGGGSSSIPQSLLSPEAGWEPHLFHTKGPLQMVASEDGLMLNTGIVFFKATAWTYWLLMKVRILTFGRTAITFHPWWDQTGLMYLLATPFTVAQAQPEKDLTEKSNFGFAPAVHMLPQKWLNGYPPVVSQMLKTHITFESDQDKRDWIVSFSGCRIYSSQTVCNMLFTTYFTLVPEHQGLLPANISSYFPY